MTPTATIKPDDGNFKPAPSFLLVLPAAREEMVGENKLILAPNAAQTQPQHGIVQRVGKAIENYEIGERVIFVKYAGKEFKINGTKFLVLHENELLGSLDTDAEIT